MTLDNDTRGWILASLSAIACFVGALVTCVDILVRLFPGKKNFRIEDSNGFLSSSLSLSAGVMLFSALYSMLPSSHSYLEKGGLSPKASAWVMLACFLGGVFGIQALSYVFHMFIPHTVEQCDHTHADEENKYEHQHEHGTSHDHAQPQRSSVSEVTPLLQYPNAPMERSGNATLNSKSVRGPSENNAVRPTLQTRMTSTVSRLVSMTKPVCDANGPCLGYSDPCGQECFKTTGVRPTGRFASTRSGKASDSRRTKSIPAKIWTLNQGDGEEVNTLSSHCSSQLSPSHTSLGSPSGLQGEHLASGGHSPSVHSYCEGGDANHATLVQNSGAEEDADHQLHHHHVPTNAFLSISLQTSVAIALHKLPEGFITYATNHANPKLGFTVFIALFIHNISEGFALALPIYLATRSRVKCLLLSAVLGGLSQPVGAGIAALWLKLAEQGRGDYAPSEKVYGGLFAVTAGIMASVGLSLLQESLEMTHSKKICMSFAFIGMGVLGASTALTA